MKRIYSIIMAVLLSVGSSAQAPEKMSYQGVVRDGNNNLVVSASVGMQISILQGSPTGTSVYVESHTPTTNVNGVVSIEIGGGTVVSGTFAGIDWGNGPYYLKTETDPTGGTTYTIAGTNQLLSVPYALYAKRAGSVVNTANVFSYEYPEGFDGDVLLLSNLQSTPYTVPSGKNLKILHSGFSAGTFSINGIVIDCITFVGENDILSSNDNSSAVNALLTDKSVDIVIIDFSSPYVVPAGRTFYSTCITPQAGGACFTPACDYYLLNGLTQINPGYGPFYSSIDIYGEATTIEYFPASSGFTPQMITGYLK